MPPIGVRRCAITRGRCEGSFSTTPCCAISSSSAGTTAPARCTAPCTNSNNPSSALVEAGLTPEQAVETYGAISVHTRGSVVLDAHADQDGACPRRTVSGIGFADDIDFDYILDSILENAENSSMACSA